MDRVKTPEERIAAAQDEILEAYWDACDAAQEAVNPAKLTDAHEIEDFLQEAFDIALRREEMIASGDAADWEDSGAYF